MPGEPDVAAVASLIGEPARAAVLMALTGGRALAAGTLAAEAQVAPSTASEHLARLVAGGLVTVERSGRHRYFRLAAPEVAEAVEALARVAPMGPVRGLTQSTHAEALRRARTCYDHLAGRLGVAMLEALVAGGLLVESRCASGQLDPVLGPGRAFRYDVTAVGKERFRALAVNLEAPGRRPLTRYCLDWSEQRRVARSVPPVAHGRNGMAGAPAAARGHPHPRRPATPPRRTGRRCVGDGVAPRARGLTCTGVRRLVPPGASGRMTGPTGARHRPELTPRAA